MMSLERSGRRPRARGPGPGRSFQEAAAAAGRLSLPHSNGERQMESYPLCQLFSQSGRARPALLARALGQLPPAGPTDGCVDRPISVPDFFTAASTGDPGHLDVLVYAPDEMRHILMASAAVRVRECDRIGDDDELDAADWLSASVLALPSGPSCAVLCPVRFRTPRGELAHWSLASLAPPIRIIDAGISSSFCLLLHM